MLATEVVCYQMAEHLMEQTISQNFIQEAEECCAPLSQSFNTSDYDDGIMSFVYDNESCRRNVTVTCT